jgi:hypothetical protein
MRFSSLVVSVLAVTLASSLALADPPSPARSVAPAPAPPPAVEPPKKHGSRLPGVLVMVLGVVNLGAGAVFGAIATATGAAARSQCTGTLCPPSAAPDIAKTKSFQDASYAALIAGGPIAAAGLALALVAPGPPEPDEAPKSARIVPWISPQGGGVGITGTF